MEAMSVSRDHIQKRVHTYYWRDDLNCATTTLRILEEAFGLTLNPHMFDAAVGLHGAGEYGAQCGLVEGALMFLGIMGRARGVNDAQIVACCRRFARRFEHRFGSLVCRQLRPEGFRKDNPPHLCEKLSCDAIEFNVQFVKDAFRIS